jgi:ElaB/YqjD/DUF883 family membrane-anchored ribosome-binding protein
VGIPTVLIGGIRDVVRSGGAMVRDTPWSAVGVAALMGLTAGYVLSRRS